MADFHFWIVSYEDTSSCHGGEVRLRFLSRDNAIVKAKEVVAGLEVSLNTDIYKIIRRGHGYPDNARVVGVRFGEQTIEVNDDKEGSATVCAHRDVFISNIVRSKTLLSPEVKEEGKPYQAAKYEEKEDVTEIGRLWFAPGNRFVDTHIGYERDGKQPYEPYVKLVPYKETRSVYVYEEVIRTED